MKFDFHSYALKWYRYQGSPHLKKINCLAQKASCQVRQKFLLMIGHDFFQGVQAQTVANFYLAFEAELEVLPIINKIDLKVARPEEVAQQMVTMFDVTHNDIIKVSDLHSFDTSDAENT